MTKTGNGISILLFFTILLGLAMGTYFPASGQKLHPLPNLCSHSAAAPFF